MRPDVPFEIVRGMSNQKKRVLNLSEVARAAGVSKQAAKSALGRLVERGIIVPIHKSGYEGIMFYQLQDLFYVEGVTSKIETLAGELAPHVDVRNADDQGETMLENLKMLLNLVTLTKKAKTSVK